MLDLSADSMLVLMPNMLTEPASRTKLKPRDHSKVSHKFLAYVACPDRHRDAFRLGSAGPYSNHCLSF